MMSGVSHFAVVLLFALGLLFRFLSHLAVIAFTAHTSGVCDGRNKQRKGDKERKENFFHTTHYNRIWLSFN